jgi:hypothetical protein
VLADVEVLGPIADEALHVRGRSHGAGVSSGDPAQLDPRGRDRVGRVATHMAGALTRRETGPISRIGGRSGPTGRAPF